MADDPVGVFKFISLISNPPESCRSILKKPDPCNVLAEFCEPKGAPAPNADMGPESREGEGITPEKV